jgi:hypothetical protein
MLAQKDSYKEVSLYHSTRRELLEYIYVGKKKCGIIRTSLRTGPLTGPAFSWQVLYC